MFNILAFVYKNKSILDLIAFAQYFIGFLFGWNDNYLLWVILVAHTVCTSAHAMCSN